MVSVSDYQREIDEINDRVNNLILSFPEKSDALPGYLVFVFLAVLGFIIYLLTKLEWKKVG